MFWGTLCEWKGAQTSTYPVFRTFVRMLFLRAEAVWMRILGSRESPFARPREGLPSGTFVRWKALCESKGAQISTCPVFCTYVCQLFLVAEAVWLRIIGSLETGVGRPRQGLRSGISRWNFGGGHPNHDNDGVGRNVGAWEGPRVVERLGEVWFRGGGGVPGAEGWDGGRGLG